MPIPTGTMCQSLVPCQQELVSSLLRSYERFQTIFKASLFLRNAPALEETPVSTVSIWQHAALAHGQQLHRRTSSLPIPISAFCCPDKRFLLGTRNSSSSAITLGSVHITTHTRRKACTAPPGNPSTLLAAMEGLRTHLSTAPHTASACCPTSFQLPLTQGSPTRYAAS